jgi:uncharacterized membrane protein
VGAYAPLRNAWFWVFAAITATVGFGVEWVGINTGFPFGQYDYRHSIMGAQVAAVPLMLGVVWWLQVYCYGVVANIILNKANLPNYRWFLRALLAAALMVATDYPMEQLANRIGLWQWHTGFAPLQNYIGWFGYGFLLQVLFIFLPFAKQNRMAAVYCVVTTAFFIGLNLFL